jgi:hypothetical protein
MNISSMWSRRPVRRTHVSDFRLALAFIDSMLERHDARHGSAWRSQDVAYHLDHGRQHSNAARQQAQKLDNLTSAALRHLMALEVELRTRAERGD